MLNSIEKSPGLRLHYLCCFITQPPNVHSGNFSMYLKTPHSLERQKRQMRLRTNSLQVLPRNRYGPPPKCTAWRSQSNSSLFVKHYWNAYGEARNELARFNRHLFYLRRSLRWATSFRMIPSASRKMIWSARISIPIEALCSFSQSFSGPLLYETSNCPGKFYILYKSARIMGRMDRRTSSWISYT